MAISVTVEGVAEAIKALKIYEAKTIAEVKAVVATSAQSIQRNAKVRSPVDTGFLRSSIEIQFFLSGLAAIVEATAEYAGYVEFGTRYQTPQPFLIPSYEEEMPNYLRAAGEALKL